MSGLRGLVEGAAGRITRAVGGRLGPKLAGFAHSTGKSMEDSATHYEGAEAKALARFHGLDKSERPTVRDPEPSGAPEPPGGGATPTGPRAEPPRLPGDHPGTPTAGTPEPGVPAGSRTQPPTEGRPTAGDPVDVATGEMVLGQTDVALPGLLALVLQRAYVSSRRDGRFFGAGWSSTLGQHLVVEDGVVIFRGGDGRVLRFAEPEADGEAVFAEAGVRWSLTREADGGYVVEDPLAGVRLHFARIAGRAAEGVWSWTATTDRRGPRIDVGHTEDGVPAVVRHSGGYRVRVGSRRGGYGWRITDLHLESSAGGNGSDVTSATGGGGSVELLGFSYDGVGRLAGVTNSTGKALRFEYDMRSRLVRWVDRNGLWYRYHYNEAGQVVASEGTDGVLRNTFAYDPDARTTTVTDALGHATVHVLNQHGQVVSVTDPLGHTTTREWDRYDRLLAETNPLGHTTRHRYDPSGNLLAVHRPDGPAMTAVYNDLHRPTRIIDALGAMTELSWDDVGNPLNVTDPTGATTTYGYDDAGFLSTVTDPLGHTQRVRCDPAGLPVEVTDADGATWSVRRDGFGRIVEAVDPLGRTTRYTFTVEGHPTSRTDPDGALWRWTWDGEDNCTSATDPMGRMTTFEIGSFDLVVARTDPDGSRWSFGYDAQLRLTDVVNPIGTAWTYAYDPCGRVVRETDLNGRVLDRTYNPAGWLTSTTNGAGDTLQFDHDACGRITSVTGPEGATTYTYDPTGRLVTATNPETTVTLAYDGCGRVTAETLNGATTRFGYDAIGRLVSRTTPTGITSTWTYTAGGRPAALATADHTLAFTHNPAGEEISRLLDGHPILAQTWHPGGRLATQTLTLPTPCHVPELTGTNGPSNAKRATLTRTYTHNPARELTAILDSVLGATQYTLDLLGRVTDVATPQGPETYDYDALGNTTHATHPVAPTPEHHTDAPDTASEQGPRHHTGTLIRSAGRTTYTHDAAGRLVTETRRTLSGKALTTTYTYNAHNDLTTVALPTGERITHTYDAFHRRTSTTRHARNGLLRSTTTYTWHGTHLSEETTTGPLPGAGPRPTIHTYDYHPASYTPLTHVTTRLPRTTPDDLAIAPQTEIDRRFAALIPDHLGTPTHHLTPDGRLHTEPPVSLWGTPTTDAPFHTPIRFPGHHHDPETGLHYNHHRHYHPATTNYATPDPYGLHASNNPHHYVPNPTGWIDPAGLAPRCPLSREPAVPGPPEHIGNNPVQEYDTVPYRPINAGFQNHHGIMDAWLKNNVKGYSSRASNSTSMALSPANHKATNDVFQDWSRVHYGKPVGARVDWKSMGPREIHQLSEDMFDAAGVPQAARNTYYSELTKYLYNL